MHPERTRHFGALRHKAANDNRPLGSARSYRPRLTEASAQEQRALPEWLLRGVMVLATAGPVVALWSVLPWLQDWLTP
jgi:hypothetical protein